MAWSNSKVFRPFLADVFGNTAAFDLDTAADTFKVALFDNSGTPNQDVTSANSAYGAGVWAAGGVSDATGWPAAGRALVNQVVNSATAATVFWDADDTVSANSNTTLSATYGCLVYDDTLAAPVADQGVSYHYFGGAQQVTAGTFTVVWNANGLVRFTL